MVKEAHKGGLSGHFGIHKTLDILAQNFFWPKMLGTIGKYVLRCEVCIKAKLIFIEVSINLYLWLINHGNT